MRGQGPLLHRVRSTIPRYAAHEQALGRERAVAAGAATLAASSDRDVVQQTAVETAAALARSAGATGVRVLLGTGHDLRHEIVATAGCTVPAGHLLRLDGLPTEEVAALRRGEAVHLAGEAGDPLRGLSRVRPKHALVTRLRAGGRDVGALWVSSDVPLSAPVCTAVVAWSTQVAASLAGLALTEELLHRAYHDPLTGLANREWLRQRLQIALGEPGDGLIGVLVLDLDRFTAINDAFGYPAGDAVLCTVADRLKAMIRPGHLAARLGSDEFGLVLAGLADADAATAVATELISALREPIDAGGHPVTIGGSVGVALRAPGTGASVEEILEDAEAALRRAYLVAS